MATETSTLFVVGEDHDPAFATAAHVEDVRVLNNEIELITGHETNEHIYQGLCHFHHLAEGLLSGHTQFTKSSAAALKSIFVKALRAARGLNSMPAPQDVHQNIQRLRIRFQTYNIRFNGNSEGHKKRFTLPDQQSSLDDL